MKKIKGLGKSLSRSDQKRIKGGDEDTITCTKTCECPWECELETYQISAECVQCTDLQYSFMCYRGPGYEVEYTCYAGNPWGKCNCPG